MIQNAFTFSANGIIGSIVTPKIKVRLSETLAKLYKVENPDREVFALWDTGATKTCISDRLADQLILPSIGVAQVKNAGGRHPSRVFQIDINIMGKITVIDIRALEFKEADAFDVIIGMDIICAGDLSISNAEGKTVVSFRIPPDSVPFDFVKEINERNEKNAYREAAAPRIKSFKKRNRRKH
jgi:predicted aspartyl protease